MRGRVPCSNDQPGGLFIQSVNETWTDKAIAVFVAMKNERVKQRSSVLAVRRMRQHSGGFVDDDEVRVFVNDVERNVLSPHRRLAFGVDRDLDEVVRPQAVTDILNAAVYLAPVGLDHVAKIHLAQVRKVVQ